MSKSAKSPPATALDGSITRRTWGAGLWASAAPLFVAAQVLVQLGWQRHPYSWSANNISDLGNVHCGAWGDEARYICSPQHLLMDVSFVGFGLLVLIGLVLLWNCRQLGRSRVGLTLLALAAGGYVVAGLAPADVDEDVHVVFGAVPVFLAGNLGMLVLAARKNAARFVRVTALVTGVVGVAGTVLFFRGQFLGMGTGGMERVAAFPLYAFLLITGSRLLLLHRRV